MKESLLCVFAHPDDEAFGPSGAIAEFAEKKDVFIVCVTDGDDQTKKQKGLSSIRKKELENSAKILGVKKVFFLGYKDGSLSNNLYHEVAKRINSIALKVKADTLLTYEPKGISGHIDHIFCSMISSFIFRENTKIKKVLYYLRLKSVSSLMKKYFIYFPEGYKKNEIDLVIDTSKQWEKRKLAIKAHQSQWKDGKRILTRDRFLPKKEYFLVKKRK